MPPSSKHRISPTRPSPRCATADRTDGTVAIDTDDVDVYAVTDCLRPFGVHLTGVYRRHVTLDDVFLELTGKQLRHIALATRNEKEALRNPLSPALKLPSPVGLLVVLVSIAGDDSETLNAAFLTPGVALFGFVMLMFTSAMLLARDRETALFARLRTAPLRAGHFVFAYGLPAWLVAMLQAAIVFALGTVLGMDVEGSLLLVAAVLVVMAVFYVALGVAAGAVLTTTATTGAYTAVLLLTAFGGAWFALDDVGGAVKTVAGFLRFSHALDAMRAVLGEGAGLGDIAGDVAWVFALSVGAVVLAVWSIGRRMAE